MPCDVTTGNKVAYYGPSVRFNPLQGYVVRPAQLPYSDHLLYLDIISDKNTINTVIKMEPSGANRLVGRYCVVLGAHMNG